MPSEIPPELLNRILSYLDREQFIQYVTVSKSWQYAVERHTFRRIQLGATELQYFSDIFVGHRRAALAELSFVFAPTANTEVKGDPQLFSQALTDAVHRLFSVLHPQNEVPGEETAIRRRGTSVSLILHVILDIELPLRGQWDYLRILRIDELPELPQISSFAAVQMHREECIEGSSLIGMAAKLPNLKNFRCRVDARQRKSPVLRQKYRFGNGNMNLASTKLIKSVQVLHNLYGIFHFTL